MRKAAVLLVSVLVIFIFLGIMLTQSLMIVQRIANVSDVAGQVWLVTRRAGGGEKPLADGARVFAGDLVKTGDQGQATLNWVDGSRIRIAPATTLKVLKCSLNKSSGATTSLFHLDVGRVWIRILEALGERSKFDIRTPTATAGVRGTIFSVAVSADGETRVSVHDGAVAVQAAGEVVEAAAGESALVSAGSAPTKGRMTEEEAGAAGWQRGIAGPRLELDLDREGEVAADAETVTVSGTGEPGAQLTINGWSVDLDAENQFTLDVPFAKDQSVLKVVVVARDQRGREASRTLVLSRSK